MAETVLRTQKLTKRYGSLTAVDGLDLEIHQGEIIGVLGPNGAGKTTSISMICGLLPPDNGQVFIHGKAVYNGGGDPELRARVGVCPQEVIIWEKLTCLEQLEFVGEMYNLPRRAARQRGCELLETLGLAEKSHQLAGRLSGGMKRRLNLALALIHDPEILVLDEPEAGLDPQSRVLVRTYLRSLARQKTILLTTHNMDEADRMADRVAIIDHGQLLVLDTPAALKRSIGEGDVLELLVLDIDPEEARTAIQQAQLEVSVPTAPVTISRGGTIQLRGRRIIDLLPAVIQAMEAAGGRAGEVHLRPNTLEDVFIALTGRSLRE